LNVQGIRNKTAEIIKGLEELYIYIYREIVHVKILKCNKKPWVRNFDKCIEQSTCKWFGKKKYF